MIVLALDIATRTGFGHDNPAGGPPLGGVLRIPPPTGSKDDGWSYGKSYVSFERQLVELVERVRPDEAIYEKPITLAGGASGKVKIRNSEVTIALLRGLCAIAELVFERREIPLCEANVMTVKKHFAGHGHADKEMMKARCRQLGWTYVDDNHADALGIWSTFKSMREPRWNYQDTPLFGARKR